MSTIRLSPKTKEAMVLLTPEGREIVLEFVRGSEHRCRQVVITADRSVKVFRRPALIIDPESDDLPPEIDPSYEPTPEPARQPPPPPIDNRPAKYTTLKPWERKGATP